MTDKAQKRFLPILFSGITFLASVGLLYSFLFVIQLPTHEDIGFVIGLYEVVAAMIIFAIILVVYFKSSNKLSKFWFIVPGIIFLFAILTVIYVPNCSICDYGIPDGAKLTFKDVFGF